MFIVSKKKFAIPYSGGIFTITKDYVGEVPDEVANHWLIQKAIESGSIATTGKKDSEIADAYDAETQQESDEDAIAEAEAEGTENEAEAEETKAATKKVTAKSTAKSSK